LVINSKLEIVSKADTHFVAVKGAPNWSPEFKEDLAHLQIIVKNCKADLADGIHSSLAHINFFGDKTRAYSNISFAQMQVSLKVQP